MLWFGITLALSLSRSLSGIRSRIYINRKRFFHFSSPNLPGDVPLFLLARFASLLFENRKIVERGDFYFSLLGFIPLG